MVRAVDVLVNEQGRTDCHFALLGFGDCLDDLKQLTTQLGLDDWITFTGRADDTMIGQYLSTADLGLDPDPKNPLNDVSTMNKVLEYMAFELPVVTFDLKETRRSAEEAAYYVEPNDVRGFATAIDRLLDDPERREKMGRIGRRRIEDELGWDRQAPVYVDVYTRLLSLLSDVSPSCSPLAVASESHPWSSPPMTRGLRSRESQPATSPRHFARSEEVSGRAEHRCRVRREKVGAGERAADWRSWGRTRPRSPRASCSPACSCRRAAA